MLFCLLAHSQFNWLFIFSTQLYCCVFKQDWQVSVEHTAIAHGVDNTTIGSNGVMQVGTD
jgi:hypothetical protein